jgi:hypothetical protein
MAKKSMPPRNDPLHRTPPGAVDLPLGAPLPAVDRVDGTEVAIVRAAAGGDQRDGFPVPAAARRMGGA